MKLFKFDSKGFVAVIWSLLLEMYCYDTCWLIDVTHSETRKLETFDILLKGFGVILISLSMNVG